MPIALRAFEMSDAPALHRMFNDPALIGRRYIEKDRGPRSRQQIDDLLGTWIQAEDETPLAVADGEDLLGLAVLDPSWEPLAPFVVVVIDPGHQRRGHGTEALELLLDDVFRTTPAIGAMTWIDEWNEGGLALANAFGFQEAGRARREGIRDGKYYASVGLDLLREEWEARSGH